MNGADRLATASPYRHALEFIERHPGCGGARSLAKLLLSLWNSQAAFSFRECVDNLDEPRTQLAVDIVARYAARGEESELVAAGYRVLDLYPELWELGVAADAAKAALRASWERDAKLEEKS